MERKIANEPKLKLIFLFRELFPTNNTFYIIFFFFKFYGLILTTHNLKGYENISKGITSVSSIFSRLLFYNTNFRYLIKSYPEICIIIFLILTFFIIGIIIDYHFINLIYKNIHTVIELNIRKIGRFYKKEPYKIITKVLVYFYLFILITGQHIIIYLSAGIFIPFLKSDIESNPNKYSHDINSDYFTQFINKSSIPVTFLAIINILSCIIIYLIIFSFIKINDSKAIFSMYGKSLFNNNKIKIITFLSFLFLPFISVANIYNEKEKHQYRLILNICAVILCSLYISISIKNFNSNNKIVLLFNNFIIIWSWFSGIIEILLYYFIKNEINQVFSSIKLFLELLNSIGLCLFINHKNNQFFEKNFSLHLFQTNEKNFSVGEIFIFMNHLEQYLNNKNDSFFNLFRLIFNHKKDCVYPNCTCSIIKYEDTQKLNVIQNGDKIKNQIHFEINSLQSSITKEQFIIIGEQEIVNRIMILFRKKNFDELDFYCICHVYYVYYFKKNLKLALYFAGQYFESQIKFHFSTLYYFYEIKKQIIKEIYFKRKTRIIRNVENDNFLLNLKTFYDFTTFILMIKKILKNSCVYLGNIFKFQKEANKTSKLSTINYSSFLEFLHSCGYINQYNQKLKIMLKNYYEKHQDIITNKELCYLLTNYYYLVFKKIPNDVSLYFDYQFSYNSISEEINYDYEPFFFKFPLIIGLSKADNFEILFIHNKLCEYLSFSKEQIIGKDFHSLIPAEISEAHKLILKQFLFIPNAEFERKEGIILNKDRYIINCSFNCKLLPKFKSEFYIIANIEILNYNTSTCLSYSLMLNNNLHFLSISKSFEEEFFFNLKMFETLKINFCDFFGVSLTKLKKRLNKKKRNSINTKKKILRNLIEENNSISILTNVSNDKIFIYRIQKNTIDDLLHQPFVIEDKIKKTQILNGLQNLTKTIDEIGLDIDWYNRVKCLGERLQISNLFDYNSNNNNLLTKEYNDDFFEQFNIKYTMKEIGIHTYYVVQIIELVDVNEVKYETENIKKKLSLNPSKKERKSIIRLELQRNFDNILQPQNTEFSLSNTKIVTKNSQSSLMKKYSGNKNLEYNSFDVNSSSGDYKKNNSNINLNNSNNTFTPTKKNYKKKIINKKSIKDNDNEENEIITGEKMELLIEDIHHKHEIFKIFLLCFFICLFILELITIHLRKKIKDKGNNFLKNNIYFQMLKNDIYITSLSLLYLCEEITYDENIRKTITYPVLDNKISILNHYSKVMKYLGTLNIYSEMTNFFTILYEEINFDIIKEDWSVYTRKSGLIEEINIFQYSISSLVSKINEGEKNECRLTRMFFNQNFLNKTLRQQFYVKEGSPSEEENIFFYVLYNIIQNYKPKFQQLSNEMNRILINFINSFTYYYVIAINLVLMLLLIIILILYIHMLLLDKKEMKVILNHLYVLDSNQFNFENKVLLFKDLIVEFTEKKINLFERAKLGKFFKYYSTSNLNKTKSKNKESSFKIAMLKNNNSSLDIMSQETPHTNLSRKPINGNKNKENENQENQEIIHESKPNLLPKTIMLGYIFISLFVLILLLLLGINIFSSIKSRLNFIKSIILCLNFLERLPRAIELMLYSHLSVIAGNPKLIKGNGLEYYKTIIDEYLNYYNYELEYERASQIESLSDSYYSNIFLENILIKVNIDKFIAHPINALNHIKDWAIKFNTFQYFCLFASLGQEIYTKHKYKSIQDFYKYVNFFVEECYKGNSIINEYGLETEYNYFYQELTNLYKDYYVDYLNENSKAKFLNNEDKSRIVKDILIPFGFAYNTFAYWMKNDLKQYMLDIGKINDYYLEIIFITSLTMFVVIYIVIQNMNDETKTLLLFFSKLF